MDIIFSFDDTGSMSSVRQDVKAKIKGLVTTLSKSIDPLRIGIIIHNDYCDRDTIQSLDLTNDLKKVEEFINRDSTRGGGDAPECYELALNTIHSGFSWESNERVAILIGDELPHFVGYAYGGKKCIHDWKTESKLCAEKGIKVYTIQALGNRHATSFYETVAQLTNAIKLDLSQFNHISQYITAVAYQQVGKLEEYQASEPIFNSNLALKNMFNKLRGGVNLDEKLDAKLAVMGRFQILPVPATSRIDHFVAANGVRYVKGRGFYQLKKSETVQDYKEIIMINKGTGETIPDQVEARTKLGLPLKGAITINPKNILACRDYDVYIQSTSYTRKLDSGTNFLYEVDRH